MRRPVRPVIIFIVLCCRLKLMKTGWQSENAWGILHNIEEILWSSCNSLAFTQPIQTAELWKGLLLFRSFEIFMRKSDLSTIIPTRAHAWDCFLIFLIPLLPNVWPLSHSPATCVFHSQQHMQCLYPLLPAPANILSQLVEIVIHLQTLWLC